MKLDVLKSPSVVIITVLGVVTVAMLWFLTDTLVSLSAVLPRALGLIAILIGSFFLARQLITDQAKQSNGDGSLNWILVGAVALSAVSFATTMFGMADFAAQQTGNDGRGLVGWFISLGTTFGIQIVMLYVALYIGRQLVRLRPTFDDQFHHDLMPDGPQSDRSDRGRYFAVGVACILFLLAVSSWMSITGTDILVFFKSFCAGMLDACGPRQETGMFVGVLLVLIAAGVLIGSGVLRNLWGMVVAGMLLLVYLVTLSISALFSFDSYYKLVQSNEDVAQRQASIVQQESAMMLQVAESELSVAREELREDPALTEAVTEMRNQISDLSGQNSEIDALLADRNRERDEQAREQRDASNQALQADFNQLEQQRLQEIEDLRTQSGNIGTDAAQVRDLEARQNRLETARQSTLNSILEAEDRIAYIDVNLQCELDGQRDPPGGLCEDGTGVASDPERLDVGRYARLTDELAEVEARLSQFRAQSEQNRADLEAVTEELNVARVTLNLGRAALELDDDGNSQRLIRDIEEINERYKSLAAELEQSWQMRDSQVAVSFAPVQVRQVGFLLESFVRDPRRESLQEFATACLAARQGLLEVQPELVQNLECQPARLARMAERGEAILAAQLQFVDNECSALRPAGEEVRAGVPTNEDLLELTARTRGCLNIANRGSDEVIAQLNRLVEIESVFLGNSTDIRRSVEDLRRGATFAVGSAVGAVAVDVLILVVGFLSALNGSASHGANPLRPMPGEVQTSIRAFASAFSTDGSVESGLRRFLAYVEPRKIEHQGPLTKGQQHEQLFRNTVNRSAVTQEDEALVNAIMSAIPLGYLRDVNHSPPFGESQHTQRREAISQTVIKMMYDMAYVEASKNEQDAQTRGGKGGAQSRSNRSQAMSARTAGRPLGISKSQLGTSFRDTAYKSALDTARDLNIVEGGASTQKESRQSKEVSDSMDEAPAPRNSSKA